MSIATKPMPRSRFEQTFRAALEHLNAGDLDAATSACTELLQARPDDPAVWQLHATVALRTGNPRQALDSIGRSLAARPGHVPSLILAARAGLACDKPEQAAVAARDAVARAPDLAEPAFLLCRALLDLADPSLDVVLQQTARRHPGCAAEWQQLGLALQRSQRSSAALAAFTRAATADPTLAAAHLGRGLMLRDAGRMTEAAVALRQAVALDDTPVASFALGLTLQDLDDESGAAEAFRAALQRHPDFAEAAVNLGISLQRLGDMPAALQAYRSAVRIRPDTLGRIAQAVTTAATGMLWLDLAAFRRALQA